MSRSTRLNHPKALCEPVSPLRVAGKSSAVWIMLVDQNLKSRTGGGALPQLPASFRGQLGDGIELTGGDERVVVIGCGRPDEGADESVFWERAGAAVIDGMRALRIERAMLRGALLPATLDAIAAARGFAIGATLASYRRIGSRLKSRKDHFDVQALALQSGDWKASVGGRALADAVNWTRALVEAPPNLLNPASFANEIRSLEALGAEIKVLDERALQRLGAGGLLAVGRSGGHSPCMVLCHWRGRQGGGNDLGLVGKGLTFDAGGLNLKMPPNLNKMKSDMAGAAAVAGALRAVAMRKARVNVVAALPLCENLIDAAGYRPGDVITSLSGLTIEVDNTDAEGRIVLADAISYLIERYRPRLLVDLATLTAAIAASLHEEYAGLFTADDALAAALADAASRSNEALWRMPLSKCQDYLVDSEIADVRNMGAPGLFGNAAGSAIAGAKFLERFAAGTRWAHLDIAGTAWSTRPRLGIASGATGYGVRLLDALVDRLPT